MKKSFEKSSGEEIKKIRRLYKQGASLSEIGRATGKDRSSVRYWIKKGFINERVLNMKSKKPTETKLQKYNYPYPSYKNINKNKILTYGEILAKQRKIALKRDEITGKASS